MPASLGLCTNGLIYQLLINLYYLIYQFLHSPVRTCWTSLTQPIPHPGCCCCQKILSEGIWERNWEMLCGAVLGTQPLILTMLLFAVQDVPCVWGQRDNHRQGHVPPSTVPLQDSTHPHMETDTSRRFSFPGTACSEAKQKLHVKCAIC